MKKKLSLILIAAVLLGTASCGEGGGTKVFGDAFSFGTEKSSHRSSHRHSKKETKKFGKKSKKKRAAKKKQPKRKRVIKKTVVKKVAPGDSRTQKASTTATGKPSLIGRWYRTKTTINGKIDKDNPFGGMVYHFRSDGVLEISYHGSAEGVTVNRPRSNYTVQGNVITVPGSGSFTIKKLTDTELVLSSRGGGEMVQYYVRQ